MTLRILLADDHAMVRAGLKRLINEQPDMNVAAEAADGRTAVDLALSLSPDVVLMDVSLGFMSGARTTREIHRVRPQVKVLALTMHEDRGCIQEMLRAGATGYLVKRAAAGELVNAIRAVAAEKIVVDPRVASRLIAGMGPRSSISPEGLADLSGRETEVMQFVARGYTNKEVSAKLGVSVKTIETYKARSMQKLGLRTRVDLVRLATDRGWFNGEL